MSYPVKRAAALAAIGSSPPRYLSASRPIRFGHCPHEFLSRSARSAAPPSVYCVCHGVHRESVLPGHADHRIPGSGLVSGRHGRRLKRILSSHFLHASRRSQAGIVSGFTVLTISRTNDRPTANAASASDRRSSLVNRTRPHTFSLRIQFSSRSYSFSSVSTRHNSRAAVAMTGRPAQSTPRSTVFSILGASQRGAMQEEREYDQRVCTSIPGPR